jgi:hypothetical protein
MSIQILLEQTKTKLKEQLKNVDLFEIMLLEILDFTDVLITDYTRWCREEAEKKARGHQELFNIKYVTCLSETKDELKRSILLHAEHVEQAGDLLFKIFYDYEFPPEKLQEFWLKVNEIIKQALNEYYPYEIPIITSNS